MQKVVKGTSIDDFIGQNRDIRGFVAKADDAGTDVFTNSDEMIDGLRLDYEDGFQGETSVGVIEWDFDAASMEVDVPRDVAFGGDVTDGAYPFTGNGFTAATSGRLVPEYRATSDIVPPSGAKLFEVDQAGNKVLRATYQGGQWTPVP